LRSKSNREHERGAHGGHRELLERKYMVHSDKILVAPFWYESENLPMNSEVAQSRQKGFSERAHFMMLGNFLHPPNADGLKWCQRSLWPAIRRAIPSAELHVYGAYPTKAAKEKHSPATGLFVHGPVVSLAPLFSKFRVNLAPLRFGAGIKGKITDGWYHGVPALTTSIGAEGMCPPNTLFGGIVGNDEEEIAKAACQLYTEEKEWNSQRENGFHLIQTEYSITTNGPVFCKLVAERIGSMQRLRQINITGALLQHNTMRATEYMSRWIGKKLLSPFSFLTISHSELKNQLASRGIK
jgi:O-antigen biosynthesis protein